MTAHLGQKELDALEEALCEATPLSLHIERPVPREIVLAAPSLVRRPWVLQRQKDYPQHGYGVSVLGVLTACNEYWQLDKASVVDAICEGSATELERTERLRKVLGSIQCQTGVDLLHESAPRLGNFERLVPRARHLMEFFTVKWMSDTPGSPNANTLQVTLSEAALALAHPLTLTTEIENGCITLRAHCIYWAPGDAPEFMIRAEEPISFFHCILYDAISGELLDEFEGSILRNVTALMNLVTQHVRINDEWGRRLHKKAGMRSDTTALDRVHEVRRVGLHLPMRLGGHQTDLWVTAAEHARALLAFASQRELGGMFLLRENPDDEANAFTRIRKLFDDANVKRALLINEQGLKLLRRLQQPVPLTIVTSLKEVSAR